MRKSLKMLALDEELVDSAEEAIDEVSKAAGVSRSGNVRGDEDVDEADEVSLIKKKKFDFYKQNNTKVFQI